MLSFCQQNIKINIKESQREAFVQFSVVSFAAAAAVVATASKMFVCTHEQEFQTESRLIQTFANLRMKKKNTLIESYFLRALWISYSIEVKTLKI